MLAKSRTDRRRFLVGASAMAVAATTKVDEAVAAAKRMRGIYPIAQTPCAPDDKLDLVRLANQVKFCTKAKVPGLIWPQMASGWVTLSEAERLSGAEALLEAAKGTSTEVIIGVQAKDNDRRMSERLAKHAAAHGASGIISLPPENVTDARIVDYYKAIGSTTPLPLTIQVIGKTGPEIIGKVYEAVPTLACVKDEAGDPLERIAEVRKITDGKIAIFAGNAAHTLLKEMELGFDGNNPAFTMCDILQRTFEMWHDNKQREAYDMFGRYAAFMAIPNVDPYGMIARGFFPEDAIIRSMPNWNRMEKLNGADKLFIKRVYQDFIRPYATT